MEEQEWKASFKAEMLACSVGDKADEEAEYQWLTAPNVEQIDPQAWARKVAPAYYG